MTSDFEWLSGGKVSSGSSQLCFNLIGDRGGGDEEGGMRGEGGGGRRRW